MNVLADEKRFLRRHTPNRAAKSRLLVIIALVVLIPAGQPLLGGQDMSTEKSWQRLKSAEPHFTQGLMQFRQNRYEAAIASFQRCLREMPRHADAQYYLANLFYIRGDYQSALVQMEQALANIQFMRQLDDQRVKMKNRTIDSYQQMLETEWENTTSCRTAREIESLAGELTDEQAKSDLLAKKQQSLRARQKAHYLYFLGNILFQLKRLPEASQKYQEAIALNPRHASAYNNAAAIAYMAGEFDAALAYLDRADERGLEDNLNLKLKHLVYEALGRSTEGILQEDLSPGAETDLGVRRFALGFKNKGVLQPPLYENCYIVFSRRSKQAVIIDPGVEDPRLDDFIRTQALKVQAVLNTHGHEDHAGADDHYSGLCRAPVGIHKKDTALCAVSPDKHLEDGEILPYDGFVVRVIHTPGHTPGSVSFLIGDFLYSGDTLFKNDIGKVWPDASGKVTKNREMLVRNIKDKLLVLPGRTRVCPGHGKTSTIADEKANNPFLRS
jgi:hydroxyacylglutathione hydrolase